LKGGFILANIKFEECFLKKTEGFISVEDFIDAMWQGR